MKTSGHVSPNNEPCYRRRSTFQICGRSIRDPFERKHGDATLVFDLTIKIALSCSTEFSQQLDDLANQFFNAHKYFVSANRALSRKKLKKNKDRDTHFLFLCSLDSFS